METKKEINLKFSLEEEKIQENNKDESPKCYIHKEKLAIFRCEICKKDYCNKCKKILTKKGLKEKIICKKCWSNFLIKVTLNFLILTIVVLFFLLNPIDN